MANYHSSQIEIYSTQVLTNSDVVTNVIPGDTKRLRFKFWVRLDQSFFDEIRTSPLHYFHAHFHVIHPSTNNVNRKIWEAPIISTISNWGRSFWVSNSWSQARSAGAWGPELHCFQPHIVIDKVPPGAGWHIPDGKTEFAVGEEHYFFVG